MIVSGEPLSHPDAWTRLVVATSNPFWRRERGSQQRIASLIDGLCNSGIAVEVAFAGRLSDTELSQAPSGFRITSLGHDAPSPPHDAPISAFTSPALTEAFGKLLRDRRPDVVVIEYIRFAFLLDAIDTGIRSRTTVVLDAHDVIHQRASSFRSRNLPHWISISREEESAIIDRFDVTVAIQQHDGAQFESMTSRSRVIVAPYAIEPRQIPRLDGPPAVGFIGVDGFHNRDSVEFILNDLWPRIVRAVPGARLVLAGDVSHRCPEGALGVVRLGAVDHPDDFHRHIDVLLNPARVGGGLKIKNAEALAAGRPVVTTTLGAQGFEAGAGASVFIQDDPDQIVSTLCSLLRDAEGLARAKNAAHALIRQVFNPLDAYADLIGLLPCAARSATACEETAA